MNNTLNQLKKELKDLVEKQDFEQAIQKELNDVKTETQNVIKEVQNNQVLKKWLQVWARVSVKTPQEHSPILPKHT